MSRILKVNKHKVEVQFIDVDYAHQIYQEVGQGFHLGAQAHIGDWLVWEKGL